MNMRSALRTTLLLAFWSLAMLAFSQNREGVSKTPESKAADRTEQLSKDLGLSGEQRAEVLALYQLHYRKMAEIKASGADKESRKEQAKKAKETQQAALERILTPAQFKRMEALDAERKAAKKAGEKEKVKE